MQFRELKLRRDPACPICGDHPMTKELTGYDPFCGIPGEISPAISRGKPTRVPRLARGRATAYSTAMSATFATLVENVRSCSTEEKLELRSLLERALIEERRKEILADHRRSLAELKTRKPKFSSSISELKKSLTEK